MRIVRALSAIVLSLMVIPIPATTAVAATVTVDAEDDAFQPKAVAIGLGDTVHWRNQGANSHDTTSRARNPDGSDGVAWWASPSMTPLVGTFDWTFSAGGHFPYHCTVHDGMAGTVAVPIDITPRLGTLDTVFSIQVATGNAPEDLVYDVQMRAPGQEEFQDWRMGITSRRTTFDPPAEGRYEFRSRLRRLSTNGASLYSRQLSLTAFDEAVGVAQDGRSWNPAETSISLGDAVHWTVAGGNHTSTSMPTNPDGTTGIELWHSGQLSYEEGYFFRFPTAGTFPYYCRAHQAEMQGIVSVPVTASPRSGAMGTTFQVRVATGPSPAALVFDIQKRDPGGTFRTWRRGVTSARVSFRPDAPGRYEFRARLRRLANDGVSYYSPVGSIRVTAEVGSNLGGPPVR